MEPNQEDVQATYSPSALLNILNNAFTLNQSKKMVLVKGIFIPGKGMNYNGVFYDSLKDEASDASITLIVPALIRNRITPNKTILFWAYITKKVVNIGGRIELQINMSELVEQTHNKYSEEELKAIELQQLKAQQGFRDVNSFLKNKIINNEKVRVKILIGKTAIIDQDIQHQLEEATNAFDIAFQRVSFTSETEIINALASARDADVLCVSRGGGENIEVFNKPAIAQASLSLKPYLITAIGHKDDNVLLQRVADKAFITPTALGQYLNDLYNTTIEELQNSRAKLVDDITKSLKANFEKQVQNLQEQLQAVEKQKQQMVNDLKTVNEKEKQVLNQNIKSISEQQKAKEDLISSYKKQIEGLQAQVSRPPVKETNWGLVIAAIIIGIIIGVMLAGK